MRDFPLLLITYLRRPSFPGSDCGLIDAVSSPLIFGFYRWQLAWSAGETPALHRSLKPETFPGSCHYVVRCSIMSES